MTFRSYNYVVKRKLILPHPPSKGFSEIFLEITFETARKEEVAKKAHKRNL